MADNNSLEDMRQSLMDIMQNFATGMNTTMQSILAQVDDIKRQNTQLGTTNAALAQQITTLQSKLAEVDDIKRQNTQLVTTNEALAQRISAIEAIVLGTCTCSNPILPLTCATCVDNIYRLAKRLYGHKTKGSF